MYLTLYTNERENANDSFIPKGGRESAGEEGIPCFQGEGIFAETNKERERL